MKIKTKKMSYDQVIKLPKAQHFNPKKPNILFRSLVRLLANSDLKQTGFTYTDSRSEEIKKEPCLILMNHSSFIDLMIVSKILYPEPYCIVCTSDGFVGKKSLMRNIGCIPTKKFVTDVTLIRDIRYAFEKLKTSVLMYPEASYTFDGCPTPLPRKLGVLLKRLNVPVVSIKTKGAFSRDPLYNCLKKRKVKVSADVSCILTREQIKEKSITELDEILDNCFTFDNFKWQQDNNIIIDEPFRADGLNRILYKCAACKVEGEMYGEGTALTCRACGKTYELTTLGKLVDKDGNTEFEHIPDWYRWERAELKREIEAGDYRLETKVEIGVMTDYKAIYMVGSGKLVHDKNGFVLTGENGEVLFMQTPRAAYSLYSDYYWYEIGDMICIGNNDILFYCFPEKKDIVAKTRMAAEELYKLSRKRGE